MTLKHYIIKTLKLILLIFILVSCAKPQQQVQRTSFNHYAKGFEIIDSTCYTTIRVFSPWHEGELHAVYYLVDNDTIPTPDDGIRFVVPLSRLTLTSCTHVGLLAELGKLDAVAGICSPQTVYSPYLQQMIADGKVADVGDAMTPNVELIVRTKPQAVMVSTYAQGDASTAKLRDLGVPVIFNNEWTENNPLARAEWIRFVGAFVGCRRQADSIFAQVEQEYLQLKQTTAHITDKRTIMSGNNFRGTWYMPSGNTFMGVLFRDAGADYLYQNNTSAFSLPLTTESVISNFSEADVWVGASARTLDELSEIDEKHTWFRSYKNKEVYNFNRRTNPTGGNDFWEKGVAHPELILSDLIKILYPSLLPDTDFYFTNKLEEK